MKSYKWKELYKAIDNKQLTFDKMIDVLLENRGIKTKKEKDVFLNPKLENVNLSSVEIDEKQVKKSLERINAAIDNNEKIVIYGDYDVDGICGTAILWETIYSFYKNVEPYIPHRMSEGYGLSVKGISNILAKEGDKVELIITVDNGIVANEAVDFANKSGIDVIITDHHVRSEKDPKAVSIVHTTKLCGTSVAYLLSQEIRNFQEPGSKNQEPSDQLDTHLELVALATVADLVPLVGGNRTLLTAGLEKLRQTTRPGLLALFSEAQIKKEDIDTYHIGHIIAPRLNASGRITHALDSLRLICTKDPARARQLAANLGQVNRDRQNYTSESTIHADIEVDIKEKFIFVSHADYEEGVIGLVASRLVEKHYRPAIAVSIGAEISKGSARSIKGFNMIEFLRTFSDHMVNAGGHPMAAGFTIETTKLETFRLAVVSKASEFISEEMLERILKIDMELEFAQINPEMYKEINKLAPFGMGNSQPVFVSKGVSIEEAKFVGKDSKHLKLKLLQSEKAFDAIYFNGQDAGLKIGDNIDIAYTIENDTWNGNSKLQLKVRDVQRQEEV